MHPASASRLPPRAVGTREAPDEPGRPTGHTNPHPICRLTRGVQSNPRPVQHFRQSVARCSTGPAATPLTPHEPPPYPTPPHLALPAAPHASRATLPDSCFTVFPGPPVPPLQHP